jgi:hypothetical protein
VFLETSPLSLFSRNTVVSATILERALESPLCRGVLHPPGRIKTGSTGGSGASGARSARRTRHPLLLIVRAARSAEPSPVLVAMVVMMLACRRQC